ncbi:MAG: NAD(P)-dependent oxidoreductase [Verrucomicrobia bacterium]|nr:NAD(P)-dependent oxidoreductase [Verrucomicrobiota bacterium]
MSASSHSNPAHAWRDLPHHEPPKRSPADRLADFLEIYGSFDEETARQEARRCIQCPEPQCVAMCPFGNRIPEWLLLTAEGHFVEAATLCAQTSVLPEICARLCPQDCLCEAGCILAEKSAPVAIGSIERFLNDYAARHGLEPAQPAPRNGCKVAVLGSGPAGLACASELERRGYAVTVFESHSTPGGLLVSGVPAFKLDKSVVEYRLEHLRKRGVEFRLGMKAGADLTFDRLRQEFDAIFLAFGAPRARKLEVPGADLVGVVPALPFIIRHNTGLPVEVPQADVAGKRVVVLGGGDTAMDCLRTAIRAGAREAVCICRRDEAGLRANRREYENAVEEGARFRFQTLPLEVIGDPEGRVAGLRCARVEPAPVGEGTATPQPIPGSEYVEPADLVLVAYGFEASPSAYLNQLGELARDERGSVMVDEHLMTSVPGIFAGSDLVRGPGLVVQSVRDARRAAAEIHAYLDQRRLRENWADQTDHVASE